MVHVSCICSIFLALFKLHTSSPIAEFELHVHGLLAFGKIANPLHVLNYHVRTNKGNYFQFLQCLNDDTFDNMVVIFRMCLMISYGQPGASKFTYYALIITFPPLFAR